MIVTIWDWLMNAVYILGDAIMRTIGWVKGLFTHEHCYKRMVSAGNVKEGEKCTGLMGGDFYTDYLSYSCIGCKYYTPAKVIPRVVFGMTNDFFEAMQKVGLALGDFQKAMANLGLEFNEWRERNTE